MVAVVVLKKIGFRFPPTRPVSRKGKLQISPARHKERPIRRPSIRRGFPLVAAAENCRSRQYDSNGPYAAPQFAL